MNTQLFNQPLSPCSTLQPPSPSSAPVPGHECRVPYLSMFSGRRGFRAGQRAPFSPSPTPSALPSASALEPGHERCRLCCVLLENLWSPWLHSVGQSALSAPCPLAPPLRPPPLQRLRLCPPPQPLSLAMSAAACAAYFLRISGRRGFMVRVRVPSSTDRALSTWDTAEAVGQVDKTQLCSIQCQR